MDRILSVLGASWVTPREAGVSGTRTVARIALIVSACVGSLACSSEGESDEEKLAMSVERAVVAPSQLSTNDCSSNRPCVVEVLLPEGVAPGDSWLASRGRLRIGDGITLTGGTLASVAAPGVYLGTGTVASAVVSEGQVELRDRARVTTTLITPLLPIRGNQTAIPTNFTPTSAKPFSSHLWSFVYPPSSAPSRRAISGQTLTLAPGNYNDVVVDSGGTITLSAGTYTFRSLQAESNGRVKLPAGQVILNVASSLTLRSSVEGPASGYDWTVIYASKNPLTIERGFKGTLLAPNAALTLRGAASAYTASAYAKELTLEAGALFNFKPSKVPTLTRAECTQLLATAGNQTGTSLDPQLAFDLLRLCQAPGIPDCYGRFMAAVNTDRYAAALRYVSKAFDTSDHLGLVRDRDRKAKRMRQEPARLSSYCNQGDSDGDLVPNPSDQCPNTPPLTRTDDNGCTSTAPLPKGPYREAVDKILAQTGVLHNAACDGTPPPQTPGTVGGQYHDVLFAAPEGLNCPVGSSFLPNSLIFYRQPAPVFGACPVWYEIRATVFEPGATSSMGVHYSAPISEADTLNWHQAGVTSTVYGFDLRRANALPQERFLLSLLVPGAVLNVQARALDGNGRFSGWSTPHVIPVKACQ